MARTEHQSNSTEDPMRYTPDPRTMIPWSSKSTSFSVPLYVSYRFELAIACKQIFVKMQDMQED